MSISCEEENENVKHDSENEEEDDYVPYVSVKERRKQKLAKLGRITEIKEESVELSNLSTGINHCFFVVLFCMHLHNTYVFLWGFFLFLLKGLIW